jgi:putative hydrolase of HD superfamily
MKQTETLMGLHARLLTLKLLPRTGWLQRGLTNVESIAEHSFSLATLTLFVSDHIPNLDRGKLLSIALIHDMAEALVGDLPFSARRLFGVQAKQEAERKGMLELLQGLPQADTYIALWDEYTNGTSREARLVKQLDKVEMLSQALAYERTGSRVMGEFWEDVDEVTSGEFPIVTDIINHLVAERQRLNTITYSNGNGHSNGLGNGHDTTHLHQNGKITVSHSS